MAGKRPSPHLRSVLYSNTVWLLAVALHGQCGALPAAPPVCPCDHPSLLKTQQAYVVHENTFVSHAPTAITPLVAVCSSMVTWKMWWIPRGKRRYWSTTISNKRNEKQFASWLFIFFMRYWNLKEKTRHCGLTACLLSNIFKEFAVVNTLHSGIRSYLAFLKMETILIRLHFVFNISLSNSRLRSLSNVCEKASLNQEWNKTKRPWDLPIGH